MARSPFERDNAVAPAAANSTTPLLAPAIAVTYSCRLALQVMTWNSHQIDSHIAEANILLQELSAIVALLKRNEGIAHELSNTWAALSVFDKQSGKVRCRQARRGPYLGALNAP